MRIYFNFLCFIYNFCCFSVYRVPGSFLSSKFEMLLNRNRASSLHIKFAHRDQLFRMCCRIFAQRNHIAIVIVDDSED